MQLTHQCTARSCNTEAKMCQWRCSKKSFTRNWTLPPPVLFVLFCLPISFLVSCEPCQWVSLIREEQSHADAAPDSTDSRWNETTLLSVRCTYEELGGDCALSDWKNTTHTWRPFSRQTEQTPGRCWGGSLNWRISPECSWRTRSCVYLRVDQCVVEQNEPVVGESPGVLQSQRSSAAAFTHHSPLWKTQTLLMDKENKSLKPTLSSYHTISQPNTGPPKPNVLEALSDNRAGQ